MSKNEKKLIYVVEASKVLSKLISTAFSEQGYEVEIFSTGLDALRKIIKVSPDCIIADKVLPGMDGMELCKIMKEGSTKASIPIVIYSTDDSVLDFWTNSIGANEVLSISNENFDKLLEITDKLLTTKYIEPNSFLEAENQRRIKIEEKMTDEEKLIFWIVDAMDKSEFYLNMIRNLLELYAYVKDTKLLIQKIFTMFYQLCNFDVITLILDNNTALAYKAGLENVAENVLLDYWNICKADYEKNAKKNHTIIYEEIKLTDVVGSQEKTDRFEAYRQYTLMADNVFIGTIHLASASKKLFSYKIQSSIEFILPSLAFLLQESLHHENVSHSEQTLRTAFSKFVPEEVINEIIKSEDVQKQTNNNEKRNVVILMCDIRNFTSISEINQPEDVVGFLNTYFTHMVEIVNKYGGTVDKFIGDAIMVLFGAPISYNDNAQRAVQAAIEMYSQLDQIPVNQLKFPEGMKLDIGIGIHYGDVIVGNIGSTDKTSYTVIGDAVNLASRLEGLTKMYGAKVIISEAVARELTKEINVLQLDSVKVKGKKESVQIYRADGKALPEEYSQSYSKGLKSYIDGAFSLAKPYFEKALEVIPSDKAARLMINRCIEFNENKPENWDGAVALTSK